MSLGKHLRVLLRRSIRLGVALLERVGCSLQRVLGSGFTAAFHAAHCKNTGWGEEVALGQREYPSLHHPIPDSVSHQPISAQSLALPPDP